MVIVCRPEFSFDFSIDAEVLDPAKEVVVPVALRQIVLEGVGDEGRHGEPVAIDAVPFVLAHHLSHLALQLVDGAERAVELGEAVFVARIVGAPDVGPGVGVLHLDTGPADGGADAATALKEVGPTHRVDDGRIRYCDAEGNMDVIVNRRRDVFAVKNYRLDGNVFHVMNCFF